MTNTAKASAEEKLPPRIRVRLKELNFYKAGYGGDVTLEEHCDIMCRQSEWPKYLSLKEHEKLISEERAKALEEAFHIAYLVSKDPAIKILEDKAAEERKKGLANDHGPK